MKLDKPKQQENGPPEGTGLESHCLKIQVSRKSTKLKALIYSQMTWCRSVIYSQFFQMYYITALMKGE